MAIPAAIPACPDFWACDHAKTEIRGKKDSLGRPFFRKQCLRCGRPASSNLPNNKIPDDVPLWDDTAEPAFHAEVSKKREEWRAQHLPVAWRARKEWYRHDYLTSPEWRARREKVMRRANGLCEGCLERRATEVHHVTYEHVGAEMLWELRAICRECHESISDIEETG
jgi:5-methylcytosine-specific restriction endonuclease McrA